VLPDPALTPGAVRTMDAGDVCIDRRTRQYRHWSRPRDDRILAEYGLPPGLHPSYEVDHLIPLDLGGADVDANLWPEPRLAIYPPRRRHMCSSSSFRTSLVFPAFLFHGLETGNAGVRPVVMAHKIIADYLRGNGWLK